MSTQIQNFYESFLTRNWTATTGDFNVSVAPNISSGIIVISPSSRTLREIVRYTAVGTNAYGPFVRVSNIAHRGLGGTTAQVHTIGEKVRMNITAEHWTEMQDDIDSIVAAGLPAGNEGEVMVYTGGNWTAGDGVDESRVRTITVSLTSDQIKTLNTVPVELIPSPGVGKVLILDQIVYSYTYGTTQYTSGGIIRPVWRGGTTAVWGTGVTGELAVALMQAASSYIGIRGQSAVSIAQLENTAIDLYAATADFATGDGTLKVFVKYRILTL